MSSGWAADKTWLGGVDDSWATAGNWSPAGGYGNTTQKATDGTIYWGDLPMPGLTLFVR